MVNLKSRLKTGQITIGSWITIGNPCIAEIMATVGFDWLTVDMEHSVIGLEQAQDLIRVIELCDVVPLVRLGENNPNLIKRVMDAGAHGVIVPMVNSREDAVRAVKAVKYPPVGTRGVGLARAQGYGRKFPKYKKWVNEKTIVIVQIEHIKAVDNLQDILSVEEVDGFMVGPYDLSGSIGRPGEFTHPRFKEALKQILQVSRFAKKSAGFHIIPPDSRELLQKVDQGYTFLGFSLDTLFLGDFCSQELEKARQALRKIK